MYKEKSTNELFNEITKSKEINLFLENNKADPLCVSIVVSDR